MYVFEMFNYSASVWLMFFSGMDAEKHGEPAYPVAAWQEAWGDFMSGLSEEGLFL